MPTKSSQPAIRRVMRAIADGAPTLFVLAVMGGGWMAVHQISGPGSSTFEQDSLEESPLPADSITLPQGKLEAAKIETLAAEMRPAEEVHTIPGRITYDETKHVEVKAPLDGILAEVLVTPGDHVESGQLLAVLRSHEIGQARAETLRRREQCAIAQQKLQREMTLSENLRQMSQMLDQGNTVIEIETAFSNRSLGEYRQGILTAYAEMQLASELLKKIQPLAESGSVSGRAIREREAERQIAETAFRTEKDQATFLANQAKLNAETDLAEAHRQLDLAWQAVDMLLGQKEDRNAVHLDDEDALSRLEVRSPFTGSVESQGFANDERVSRGDSLIVLANTDSLYAAASIRESDWFAVSLTPGTLVSVLVPALKNRLYEAPIRYIGRQLNTETNSVPLVAAIDNSDGLLRPGMFVRVTVPIGKGRDVLSVKAESVVQHENQEFVFVATSSGTFQRVDVSTGQASDDWIEITAGLSPGQPVVTKGSFLLKSELLLLGESE